MEENLFTFEKSEQVSNEYISNLNVSKNEQQQNAIETNSVSEAPKQEDDVVDFQTIQNLGELDRESVIKKINTTTDEKERNELTACLMLDDMRLTMLDNQRKAPLRAITEDATRMESNVESMSDDDVDEELLAGFKAFGLIGDYESIDDVCNTTFNGEGKKQILKKMREQFYPFLDRSKKIEEFNNLTPENQRKFLEDRIKEKRMKAFDEAGGNEMYYAPMGTAPKMSEALENKRKQLSAELRKPITEEEIKAEKKDFIMNDYVTRCQNAMKFTQDPQVLSLGIKIALNGEKAEHLFAPQLVNLPKEKQMETLQVAYAFNKDISTWWKITDNLVKGWSGAMGLPEKISEYITTDPVDFFDFVNKNGGLEKVLNDEKLTSKAFAYNGDKERIRKADEFGFKHYGVAPLFNNLGFTRYYADKKEDIPNMAKKIYTLGKRIHEIKEVQNQIKQITAPRYYSEGWLEDKVIEGLSFGLEFGQFALLSYVTGGIGGVSKLGASGLNAINKMSNTAKALNKVASVSHKASQSASFLTKATTPYFFARMSNDAIETAQMYGLDKDTAFWGGIVVGAVNGALERLQFKTRQQNTFLVDSIVNKLLSKEKGVVFEVSKNVIMEGLKKRGVTFFEEYLIENTQNVVEEAMLQVEQIIDGKNVRGLDKAFEDIFKQAGEMIIPLLVATNIGASKGILKGGADILTAQVVKGDELAINSLKEKAILETVLSNAQTNDISAQDVIDYIDAKTPEDKAKILNKYEGKKKAVAQKLFTESDDMWAKHEAQAMLKVEKAITGLSEEDINQGRTIQQAYNELKKEESRNMAFHFIDEFIEAYGGRKDLVVFVDSFDNLPESLKTNENMQRYRDKIEGFFNPNDKKVYIIGDNTMTPKRVLQVLKHEKIHWGVSDINKSKKLRDFFDSVIDAYGGEQIVRAGIYNVKGDAYKKLGKYEMAEEFVSMIAENVKAKHELSEKESKVWKKVKSFVLNMNGVSKNASDEFVSDYIRALWERDVEDSFFGEDEEGVKLSISNEALRQYDEVKAQWTNPDGTTKEGYMLAPNGQPTKLTEEQWVMVRTPNFKNWFGEWENDPENASKVVDENGEPLVVYHGTNWEFNSFKYGVNNNSGDRGYLGRAFYATNDLGIAETYADDDDGRVMELFLNIRNPYMSKDSRHTSEPDSFANDIGVDTYAVSHYLKNEGFDGVISETEEYARNDSDVFYKEYAVYNSNQIKSATDNVGTFDSANDDIRFSIKADTRTQEEKDALNQKFRDLYEQYKNESKLGGNTYKRIRAYEEAIQLVKEEAERKGYAVKVYHGTGADRFNVAKADSSEQQNGEGAQAYGAGLYMAVSKDTAEKYRYRAIKKGVYDYVNFIDGLSKDDLGFTNISQPEWNSILNTIETMVKTESDIDNLINDDKTYIKKYPSDTRVEYKKKEIQVFEKIKKEGLIGKEIKRKYKTGHLFDWFTNLNPNEIIDRDKPIAKQRAKVKKAILKITKEFDGLNNFADSIHILTYKEFEARILKRLNFDQNKLSQILLDNGIKGLTYVGIEDGRCYVSFEGGATVKLQDPFTFDDNGELIPLTERFNEGNPDMRFSLIGVKGVANLRTSGKALKDLEKAKSMMENGEDADTIWQNTGWEYSEVDNKWRFEIPYGKLKDDPKYKRTSEWDITTKSETYKTTRKYKLSDIWDAPVLFEAYPELKDFKVKFNSNSSKIGGASINIKEKIIKANLADFDLMGKTILSDKELEESIQHEIQHYIQDVEEFAQGGNPSLIKSILNKASNPAEYERLTNEYNKLLQEYHKLTESIHWDGEGRMPKYVSFLFAKDSVLYSKYSNLVDKLNDIAKQKKNLVNITDKEAYDKYMRLGGEVESRNTEKRIHLSEDELKSKRPSSTAPIDSESQILFFGGLDEFEYIDKKTGEFFKHAQPKLSFKSESESNLRLKEQASRNLDREFAEIGWDSRVKLSLATHEKRGRKTLEEFMQANIDAGFYTEDEAKENLRVLDEKAELTKTLRGEYKSVDEWSDFENNFESRGLPKKTKKSQKPGREWFTILISNGDYDRNIDMSTICKKRRALNRLLNLLIRKGVLTAEDFGEDGLLMAQIREIIKANNLEVACDLCFVDAKRYAMAKWAVETAELWNDVITELFGKDYKATLEFRNGKPDLTEVEFTTEEQQKIVDEYAEKKLSSNLGMIGRLLKDYPKFRKRINPTDFLASDGIENIRKYAGELYTYINNRGGQSSPKKSFLDIASNSQIIFAKILGGNDPKKVNKLLKLIYKEAGVRIQSFTDFIPYLFFDYVQIISELSAKKMPMHSYTKELAFAMLFGLTGIKINLSIVPEGLGYKQSKKLLKDKNGNVVKDENGNPIYEVALDKNGNPIYTVAKESIDLDEAFALRNKDGYDKSVGSIAIGVNDYQIEIMLNDERIDMIIPYHSSGLNGEAKHYMKITGFKDYTDVQTDKFDPDVEQPKDRYTYSKEKQAYVLKKVPKSLKFDFYGDLAKTQDPRKTADNYLEHCKKNKIRPKFKKFSNHKNYYKLLTDFKLFDKNGNYAPQQAVKPVYPEDFEKILKKSLDEYDQLMKDYYTNLPKIVAQMEAEGLIENQELSKELEEQYKDFKKTKKGKTSIVEDMLTGWRGISNTDMPFSIKSDPKGTIKRIKAKQIAKEVVENMSKNQENRKDSSPMFNDDYTQKLMGELRKEIPSIMSDEDIEDIIDNAEVIAYKMWAKSKAKNQPIRFDEETANDYARHQIMDDIIRSEMREFAKNFKLEQREKELEKKAEASRLNKKLREQKGYSVKEIEADGIDIVRAFSEGEDSALKMVNKIVEKVSKANDDYDVYLANLIPTMSNVFEYAIDQLVYGRNRETALRRLLELPKSNSVESLVKKSTELAQRMSRYYEKQIADQLEEQLDKQHQEEEKQIERIKKYAKQQILKVTKEKLPDIRTPELKRKIPALLQLHYNMIQKAVKMSSNARDERMEYLRNRKSKLEEGGLDLNYREAEELAVLSKYAGLEDMTPAQLMDILADLKAIKNGAKDELFMKKAEWEESIEEMAKPLVANLSQHENKINESEGLIKQELKGLTMLKQRLEMLFAKNRSEEVDAWINRMVSNISRASIRERNFIGKEQEWLNKTIKECYKSMFDNRFGLVNTEMQAVSRLCKPNPKFAKYSKTGDYDLSIGQLMMIVSGLEQTNVKMWYEQAKERLERLESKEELSDIEEVKLKKLREQIATWEKAYENYDAMKNELTSEDIDFLTEIKKRFTERADLINEPLVKHSGLPLLTVGLNYMPIVREGEYSIMVHGASKPELIPAVYSARTLSPLYFDETANVLGVFHSRTKTDAHFINFSDIQWEMSSLFANKEMGDAIKSRVKKETRNQLERVITDVLRGSTYVEETANSKLAGKIATVGAFAGMAFNLISALKQPTSAPAFALETGVGRYLKGWASLMGSGRVLEFMNDILNSEDLKYRRGEGINQILSYLASEERQAKGDQDSLLKIIRRLYSVWGFKPMQLADTVGFLGATGVYWERYLGYRDVHDEQTAKKLAMEDIVAIGEMTQQSGLIHNLSESQRKSGGLGRLFTLFRSTNQQWLSYEMSAINDAIKNPKSVEAWKKVGRVVLLNHFLLPLFFNGFGVLIDLLLGGTIDWDDEDERNEFIAQFFISGAMDVFCGWWVGSIIKGGVMRIAFGDRFDAPSLVVPASSTWERIFSAVFDVGEDLWKGDTEGFWEEVNKMAKTVVPLYRTGAKVYERITDDEEGTFWW